MKFYLLGLLIVQINLSFGQLFPDKEKDKEFKTNRYATYLLALGTGTNHPVQLHGVNSIDVADARADTFALGYMKKGMFRAFKKIQFASPGLTELANFCDHMIKPDTMHRPYNILLVVKELWLSEEDPDLNAKDNIKDLDERIYPESNIKIRFEFYLKESEKYFPIYRYDTSFSKTLPLISSAAEHIETALAYSLHKLSHYNFKDINSTKKPLSISEIQNFNRNRFEMAILKDTSFQKGVYVSIEEFKNNRPSISEFEVKRGKLGDALYTKSGNGTWAVNRSVWGYCDGTSVYIKSGDNYYRLHRLENSFYFQGSKQISRFHLDDDSSRGRQTYYYNVLSPLKLNIETGIIY